MDEEEYESTIAQFRERHFREIANFNLALAEAFMKSNAKKQGIVQAIPGKVQYTVLQPGRGAEVTSHSTPQLRFTGRFIDGTVFTEPANSQAVAVSLDEMIPGFQTGVIGMREGEKRRIFVHPDAAYGVTGDLAPNSLLLFEVEAVKTGGANVQRSLNKGHTVLNTPDPKSKTHHDSWDLTLDAEEDDEDTQDDDDDFSSQRIVLQPVTSQKQTSAQNRGDRNRW
jgi:peptidylprolyl isomerase